MVPAMLAAMLLGAAGTPTAEAEDPKSAGFDRIAWIEGSWVSDGDGMFMEEIWTPAAGDAMMGMFRIVRGGTTLMYELIAVERDSGLLVMKLKHFDRGLIAWEEKAEVHAFALDSIDPDRAVFVTRPPQDPKKLIYTRRGPDGLEVVLEKQAGGKQTRQTFTYRRKQ